MKGGGKAHIRRLTGTQLTEKQGSGVRGQGQGQGKGSNADCGLETPNAW